MVGQSDRSYTDYDRIGRTYSRYRCPDPRIADQITRALGGSRAVVSVGSGTGSYEPPDRHVVAVEPSLTMIGQRPGHAAPVVRGVAEHLPFAAQSFDAAMAILTVHHWADPVAGLREIVRVARRQVVLTWDPGIWRSHWLVADYLPQIPESEEGLATLDGVRCALDVDEVWPVAVPWDCTDGFCGAYWRRPEKYLDPDARAAISGFARCDPEVVARAMSRLERDLGDGTWNARYGGLFELDELDIGYRLVIAEVSPI